MHATETFTMRIPKDELARIDRLAKKLEISRSRLFRRLAEISIDAIEENGSDPSWPIKGKIKYRP